MLATSKTRQRERFAEAGVPQPGYRVVPDARGGALGGRRARLSVRREGAGPAGPARALRRRRAGSELEAAVAAALELSRSGGFLVEELVAGQEVTVNALPRSAAGSTRSPSPTGTSPSRRRSASRSRTPGRRRSRRAQIAKAIDAARKAAAALGHQGRADVHAGDRLGGGRGRRRARRAARRRSRRGACRAALGVDLNGLAISAALGEQIRRHELAPQARVGGACMRFLVAPPGRAARGRRARRRVRGRRRARDPRLPPAGPRVRPAAQRRRPRRRDPRRRRLGRGGAGARRRARESLIRFETSSRARRCLETTASASSRRRSARRRSPRSPRRSAPAG